MPPVNGRLNYPDPLNFEKRKRTSSSPELSRIQPDSELECLQNGKVREEDGGAESILTSQSFQQEIDFENPGRQAVLSIIS
jgi:hypothetical protein